MFFKIIFLLVISQIDCEPINEKSVDFSGHKLIRILPKRQADLRILQKYESQFNIDYWNPPMLDMRPVLTLINEEKSEFLSSLNSSKIEYEITAHNFQKIIDRERNENEMNKAMTREFDYSSSFHTYTEILSQVKRVAANNSKATYKGIGFTYERREIPSITITNPGGSGKKAVIVECGIHAREWISHALCLWIMNSLLTNSSNEALLDKFEFSIVPVLNADGYVYTHTVDRTWRKTRSPQSSGCYGVDPNRNWDSAWSRNGASNNPCSESYCGIRPFSDKEPKAMADFILTKRGNIAAYFAIHSFSQLWMYPYGYTNALPPNNRQLSSLSAAAVKAIRAVNGLEFKYGTIANTIYLASGSSIDWANEKAGSALSFALELRDQGQYGFVLPASQIRPACMETWAGIRSVLVSI